MRKKEHPALIVMLTRNDRTVPEAPDIFEECRLTKAGFWGFKEVGLSADRMKKLFETMRENGKKTCLEVVAYTEKECLDGAKLAVECGCDFLLGTLFYESILSYCIDNRLRYLPFVGKVSERPSILEGSASEMIEEASRYLKTGTYGLDLLGYRYTGDKSALIETFVRAVDAPVCVAGSINSWQRLDEIRAVSPDFFTIGGGFFENRFGDSFAEQIDSVCDHML